jgi:hypothetical protein
MSLVPVDLKSAIVTLLKQNQQIGMNGNLCCYYDEGFYCVDYLYSEESSAILNLTDSERKLLRDEDELCEFCDTPEEAADFYLRLTSGKMFIDPLGYCGNKKKKTAKETAVTAEKDQYF